MTLRIFNTLGRNKEVFEPLDPPRVRMYVCGPTVYDSCHIGHARSVVVFDVIVRYLKASGYEVTYVRNFTDVDDKIINRAHQLSISPVEVAERYIREFYEDMDALNVERATYEPRATEHITEIIGIIQELLAKGMAYVVEGDVYYAVDTFAGYGKLSGRRLEDMEAGARVEVDGRKTNPFDFALWKSAKPGEPAWESPWSMGRPGWHIECSAMSSRFLGKTFDIHGGGKDLVFPHHENEIAQSEGATGELFAKYWIHNGFVNINQEKMSKSLGNFLMIRDVLKTHHPEAVRLFLLSNHYRSPIDFTEQNMAEAATGLDRLYATLLRLADAGADPGEGEGEYWTAFREAMDDDFNTARGTGILFDAVRAVNRDLDEGRSASGVGADIRRMGNILGILTQDPETYFRSQKERGLSRSDLDAAAIDALVKERTEARKAKNWKRADEIRDQLASMNIAIEDRPDGTVWKYAG